MEESDEASASSGSEMHDEDDSEGEEDPLATSDEDKDEEDKEDKEENVEDDDDGDSSEDESEEETQAEKDRKAAFFASEAAPSEDHSSFVTMNLSRPLIKSITALGFSKPTPIQAATVPVALLGKDVVGNAVTGSGKTAAFIIPMIERLLYRERGKNAAATRCLVLVPTRELGVQCYEVGTKLAKFTDIRFCLIVGMYSICIR
jgi:ATP-dependent RNA helicase DDX27